MAGVNVVSIGVWTFVIVSVAHFTVASSGYQTNATGSAVVLHAIGSLQQSGVFENDNEILRRIAYVETRDGKLARDGGIWAVMENKFIQIKNSGYNIQLQEKIIQIQNSFGINWRSVQWRDLGIPLYSAIAARLVLYLTPRDIPPANDLKAQARFWVMYYNPDGDEDNFVGVSSALQGGVLDNFANEFFLGFSSNPNGYNVELQLLVTTPESSPVRFTVNATGFSYSGIATQNSSTNVTLPNSLQVRTTNERDKGIYIKAEEHRKIGVYGINYRATTTDAFLALPCNQLPVDEYEYYAVTYPTRYAQHHIAILIVGCEDNTVVSTNSTIVTVDRLQTYLIRSPDDLTGMRITSNKPIALFSNHECANVPNEINSCDHLTEQIPPTATWGRVFLAASLLGRRSGERYRIVAAQPPTNVSVNCTKFTQTVNYFLTTATNWQEFEIFPDSFCSIISTAPILVAQFASGSQLDGRLGDPFMMLIPPVEQFNTNSYVFNSLSTFDINCITVYVKPEHFQPEKIYMDENSLNSSLWSQVEGCLTTNNVCGYITRVQLTTSGDHQLYHLDCNARIGVSVYGFRTSSSYGYPGGMELTPLQLSIISFTSATYHYEEEIGGAQITIVRSGNVDSSAVILVASNNIQITICDRSLPVSPILEFQPGETEKHITVTVSNITRVELYLSAGEGAYLTPFPRTEISVDGLSDYYNYSGACLCHGINCSCVSLCSETHTTLNIGYDNGTTLQISTTTIDSFEDSSTVISDEAEPVSVCTWCIVLGVVLLQSAIIVGVIIAMIILVIKFKERKQSSEKRDVVVEMQKCEAYDTIKHSGQGCDVGMEENVYDEVL